MQKRILLLICLCASLGILCGSEAMAKKKTKAPIAINEANFPNRPLREELAKDIHDRNRDGKLSQKEIKKIDSLWIQGREENDFSRNLLSLEDRDADFSALKHLTSLESVSLDYEYETIKLPNLPQLKELSISGRSNDSYYRYNPERVIEFKELTLGKMPKLRRLEVINYLKKGTWDLSAYTSLRNIEIWQSEMTGLKLNCPKLKILHVPYNKLKGTLNLKKFKKLQTVGCEGNNLSEIKTNNPRLTFLSCPGNQIKKMDLSGCPNLKILIAPGNGMQSINLRKNIKLQQLDLVNNELRSLSLKKNTNLEYVDLQLNMLKKIVFPKKEWNLMRLWAQKNRLTRLDLGKIKKLKKKRKENWQKNQAYVSCDAEVKVTKKYTGFPMIKLTKGADYTSLTKIFDEFDEGDSSEDDIREQKMRDKVVGDEYDQKKAAENG